MPSPLKLLLAYHWHKCEECNSVYKHHGNVCTESDNWIRKCRVTNCRKHIPTWDHFHKCFKCGFVVDCDNNQTCEIGRIEIMCMTCNSVESAEERDEDMDKRRLALQIVQGIGV